MDIIGFAFMLALYFTRSITSPVQHIVHVVERFGNGDNEARVAVNSPDESGFCLHPSIAWPNRCANAMSPLKKLSLLEEEQQSQAKPTPDGHHRDSLLVSYIASKSP